MQSSIAEKELTKEQRDQIRCAAKDIEINDFTGYMSNQTGFIDTMKRTGVKLQEISIYGRKTYQKQQENRCFYVQMAA